MVPTAELAAITPPLPLALQHAPGVPKILVGNRLHLAFKRQVPTEQARAYAERLGVTFFEVSPLCNFNITESFVELARTVLLRHGMDGLWRPSKGRRRLSLGDAPGEHRAPPPSGSQREAATAALPAGPRGRFQARAEVKVFVSEVAVGVRGEGLARPWAVWDPGLLRGTLRAVSAPLRVAFTLMVLRGALHTGKDPLSAPGAHREELVK